MAHDTEKLRELLEALRPFAEAATNLDEGHRDHWDIWESAAAISIEARHLRRARALISQAEGEAREHRPDAWPAGCIKANSCGRNMQCMYAPTRGQCRHFGRDIQSEVRAALAVRPNTQTEQEP